MYSTSSGRGFLPLVTAAHEISPTCSCKINPGVSSGIYTSVNFFQIVWELPGSKLVVKYALRKPARFTDCKTYADD